MVRRRARDWRKISETLVPSLLALIGACFRFFPRGDQILGSGADGFFNLWTFELVWKHLSQYGLGHVFSDGFWQAPIFYPQKLALALSEAQLYLGILSWPIRQLTGNGNLTLGICASAMSLAAFVFATLWLRSVGVERLSAWGGVFFASCGWLQKQTLHYQNLCIFLFPLALWSWERFKSRPSFLRGVVCAAAFGWIGGWNLYYQIFANLILVILLGFYWTKNKSLWLPLLCLGGAAAAIELPIVLKYFQVSALIGGLSVSDGTFKMFSATPLSWLADVPTVLQRLLPFYPRVNVGLEGSGFLGFTWLVCSLLAWRRVSLRPFLWAALAAWLVSLGPNYGVFYLVKYFPGFRGARAIGRVQILVMLFSLPAVMLFLQSLRRWQQGAVLFLIALELIPGAPPFYEKWDPAFFNGAVPEFVQALERGGNTTPLLVTPNPDASFQVNMLKSSTALFGGYSGRELTSEFLLGRVVEKDLRLAVIFSQAQRVAVTGSQSESLRSAPYLAFEGCYSFYGANPCLFDVKPGVLENPPRLRLDVDAKWSYPDIGNGVHIAVLRALRSGVLDYNLLTRCGLDEELKFRGLPAIKTRKALPMYEFRGVEFKKDEVILELVSKQAWFSLPQGFRPHKTDQITCPSS